MIRYRFLMSMVICLIALGFSLSPKTLYAQEQEVVHVVESGETLARIAQQYSVPVSALVEANSIEDPSLIHVGQRIVIDPDRIGDRAANTDRATVASVAAPEAPRAQGKVILVSISQQHLWAYENGEVQLDTVVTTGRPGANTPTGSWDVLVKHTDYLFVSPFPEGHEFYYTSSRVNYSLRYTWDGYHIHDAPWRSDYGPGTNVPHQDSQGRWQEGSIGCINVPYGAMARLFEWADVGTTIVVVD